MLFILNDYENCYDIYSTVATNIFSSSDIINVHDSSFMIRPDMIEGPHEIGAFAGTMTLLSNSIGPAFLEELHACC